MIEFAFDLETPFTKRRTAQTLLKASSIAATMQTYASVRAVFRGAQCAPMFFQRITQHEAFSFTLLSNMRCENAQAFSEKIGIAISEADWMTFRQGIETHIVACCACQLKLLEELGVCQENDLENDPRETPHHPLTTPSTLLATLQLNPRFMELMQKEKFADDPTCINPLVGTFIERGSAITLIHMLGEAVADINASIEVEMSEEDRQYLTKEMGPHLSTCARCFAVVWAELRENHLRQSA